MKKQAAVKEVQVQMIYRFKEVARICFIVESSNGVDQYNTCFSNDAQHGNCTCPSTSPRGCYHLNQLRPLAQAYFDARKQVAIVTERQRCNAPLNNANRDFSLLR